MIDMNFSFRQRSELHVLLMQGILLLLHVGVDLCFLCVHKFLVQIDDQLQFLDLLSLLLDPVSVLLSQVKIQGCHIFDCFLVHQHLLLLLLKLRNHSH